jgi:hypothetical protein
MGRVRKGGRERERDTCEKSKETCAMRRVRVWCKRATLGKNARRTRETRRTTCVPPLTSKLFMMATFAVVNPVSFENAAAGIVMVPSASVVT